MPNRTLDKDELLSANALLENIRSSLLDLAGDDAELLFAYRRKVAKMLTYDERSSPMVRRKLKAAKRVEQNGICPRCEKPLPDRYVVLDRTRAADGYTAANTTLICEPCDRIIQAGRRYA